LNHRVNAVFNSRSSILVFHDRRPGTRIPHNLVATADSRSPPDSP
jgi:hypothetical protein